jgi:cytochrome c-type biogenesis protein CcmH
MIRRPHAFRRTALWALAMGALALSPFGRSATAVEPDEMLKDPALEQRARRISSELRCLVCQNQSIDDSSAPLARDLRLLVRERLSRGDSDEAVLRFVVERYGTFVLLRPPLSPATVLLWLAPLLLLAGGGLILYRHSRRPADAPVPASDLSPDEQQRLARLLDKRD